MTVMVKRRGAVLFQGGMTAPPKGLWRNFTIASLHLQRLSTPPPPTSDQTVTQKGRGRVRVRMRKKTEGCSCHQHHPLSTSLLSSAGVLMIYFPPDMRKLLLRGRKQSINATEIALLH